jgi:hypothetical protein
MWLAGHRSLMHHDLFAFAARDRTSQVVLCATGLVLLLAR